MTLVTPSWITSSSKIKQFTGSEACKTRRKEPTETDRNPEVSKKVFFIQADSLIKLCKEAMRLKARQTERTKGDQQLPEVGAETKPEKTKAISMIPRITKGATQRDILNLIKILRAISLEFGSL